MIDTGDCKDHFGADTGDEQDNYISRVRGTLPYLPVNAGVNALFPILPGNHDEVLDYTSGTMPTATDFSLFDARFWGAPYHWTCDWEAPRIRFIAFHSYIHHAQGGLAGTAHVDASERAWLAAELAALPANWRAIVCSHFPANPAFGNNIWSTLGGTELLALLATYSSVIPCYLNGHRHDNMGRNVLNGITHFDGPGMAYTLGNGYGGFVPITYDDAARTLTFDYLYGPPHPGGYTRYSGYTPVVVQLAPIMSLAGVRRS